MEPSSRDCEQARFWASLAADGEPSELEAAALEVHARSCEACRSFALELGKIATTLRGVALVEPPPFRAPVLRRRVRPPLVAAALAVVALAAGAGSLVGTLSSGSGSARHAHVSAAAQKPFIEQQLLALAIGVAEPQRGRGGGRVIAS